MKKIDLSGCKPGDVLIREDGKEVIVDGFAEKIDEDGRKINAVMCSDRLYRRLDGDTPYGVKSQDIKAIKKSTKDKNVFSVEITIHHHSDFGKAWIFEVPSLCVISQKTYSGKADAVRGAKRFFKKIGHDYKVV